MYLLYPKCNYVEDQQLSECINYNFQINSQSTHSGPNPEENRRKILKLIDFSIEVVPSVTDGCAPES